MSLTTFKVEPLDDALKKAQKQLSEVPNGFQKAFVSAANRAVESGRATASRELRNDYTLKPSSITKTFKMKKMKAGALQAEFQSIGRRIPVSSFKHRPSNAETTGANRKQVRVEIKKGRSIALRTALSTTDRFLYVLDSRLIQSNTFQRFQYLKCSTRKNAEKWSKRRWFRQSRSA